MGQKLRDDKINAISHSGGVITLNASFLTIGGQQYATPLLSRTIATDVTMVANTLYMVYAVLSSGVPVLRISANVNSAGPSGGFLSWKLVGAFYSNGNVSVAFGSFVNIKGVPKSNPIQFVPVSSFVTNVAGSGGWWTRDGEYAEVRVGMNFTGASNAVTFTSSLPSNLGNFRTDVNINLDNYGYCHIYDNAGSLDLGGGIENNGNATITSRKAQDSNNLSGTDMNSGDVINLNYRRQLVNFSNTALEDL